MNDNVDYTSFTQPHTAIYSWPILQRYIWPMHSYCCQRWSVRILVATGRWSYYVELVRTRRYPREGVSEVSVTSFIDFWQLQICCWPLEEKWEQLFFGDKIPHLERLFWKLGCVTVLLSIIRILRASLVQIDTEMTNKFSNQRYVVKIL